MTLKYLSKGDMNKRQPQKANVILNEVIKGLPAFKTN